MAEEQSQKTNKTTGPNDFHVYVKPGTADWLRRQVNRDQPSVPAVIREIVEEAQRRAEAKSARS